MHKQVGPKICIVFLLALVRKKYNNETKLRNVFLGFLGSRSISTAAVSILPSVKMIQGASSRETADSYC